MPKLQNTLMHKLYGYDIWAGFSPADADEGEAQGWNGKHPSLSRLAKAVGNKVIVDVGVFKGQSTITMALSLKENSIDGVVISVDTFLGSLQHWDASRQLFNRDHGMPDLYRKFLSNVAMADVAEYVIPMPQTSTGAAQILKRAGIEPNLVHIDAAHEYLDVMRDVEDYWEILQPGGFLIGDDYDAAWVDVVRAVGEFSARVGKPLMIEPPKWILAK